ncbi:MAG: HAMP domain-containing histidine kinase [Polyangiaceae bacterium]|jgi:signal transduction histidine kinase|nr:HAMP domain-containing histidine kinase [Polyangiaceae bacterium]
MPRSLWPYLLTGVVLGLLYAALNIWFDAFTFGTEVRPVAPLSLLHEFVDRGIPVIVGALLGIFIHYWRVRSELARTERARAEELALRLDHVERDRAVWIIATSTLHEVNNPLHTLGLLLEEMGRPGEPPPPELMARTKVQLDRIRDKVGALRALANSSGPSIESLRVDEVLGDVLSAASGRAARDGIDLADVAGGEVKVSADPKYLRIIVENLVDNAIAALRRAPGTRRLSVYVEAGEREVAVRVSDSGQGVAPELRETIFEPLATTKERSGGLGLGLAVARGLARAMRGDLIYEPRPGWATTFTLTLPVA